MGGKRLRKAYSIEYDGAMFTVRRTDAFSDWLDSPAGWTAKVTNRRKHA